MHACGHDIHMTCWTGTAQVLVGLKDRWSGTLMFIGQPAEEIGAGARGMLDARPVPPSSRVPTTLWLCTATPAVRTARWPSPTALALANVDSVDILVKGRGGHGAHPHTTVDPVVLAAAWIVLDQQTIVSRETNPLDPVVVTVGSIHGGTKHNIIPNEVRLQITVRTTKDATSTAHVGGDRRTASPRPRRSGAAGRRKPVVKNRPQRVHAVAGQRQQADAADDRRAARSAGREQHHGATSW